MLPPRCRQARYGISKTEHGARLVRAWYGQEKMKREMCDLYYISGRLAQGTILKGVFCSFVSISIVCPPWASARR